MITFSLEIIFLLNYIYKKRIKHELIKNNPISVSNNKLDCSIST